MSLVSPTALKVMEGAGYTVLRALGKGEYGVVLLAERDGEKLAVKVTTMLASFQAEVAVLSQLRDHPNIVKYHGCWSRRVIHCIDFDYVPGHTMLELLMKGPFSEKEAHAYFRQMISGLSHANQQGIAHRDMKAENLMITPAGHLHIIDWGMSFQWNPSQALSQTCGSPDYAAPELYRKASYIGPELDVWAMGIVLYAMVTSTFPFPGGKPMEIAYRVCKGVYLPPTGSEELCHLVSRMLTVSREDRIDLQGIRKHPWYCGEATMLTTSVGLTYSRSNPLLRKSDFKEDIYQSVAPPPLHQDHLLLALHEQDDHRQDSPSRPTRRKKKRNHHRNNQKQHHNQKHHPNQKRPSHAATVEEMTGIHQPAGASNSDPTPSPQPGTAPSIRVLHRSSSWDEDEKYPLHRHRSMLGWWKSKRNVFVK